MGGSLHIAAWESTVRLWLFGGRISSDCCVKIYCKIVIIRWEDLSGLQREDLLWDCDYSVGRPLRIAAGGSTVRLWLFVGRISPDGGGRIPDSHYLVGSPLRMVAGGSTVRLWLFVGMISQDGGGRIPNCDYLVGRPLRMVAGGSTVRLWIFGGKNSPVWGGRIYCKIVIIRWKDLSGLRREDLL